MSEPVAPYVQHQLYEQTLAAAAAPVWNPSDEIRLFLGDPAEEERVRFADWIAEVHGRGVCEVCVAPLEWSSSRRRTCTGKHRQKKYRKRRSQLGRQKEGAIYDLIALLSTLEYTEPERCKTRAPYQVPEDAQRNIPGSPSSGTRCPEIQTPCSRGFDDVHKRGLS